VKLKRLLWVLVIAFGVLTTITVIAQTSPATAEAVGQANLRSAPSLDSEVVGQIAVGTRYPILGRSALYPWLLLGNADSSAPLGWVFRDLVTTQGDLIAVPVNESALGNLPAAPLPSPTPATMVTTPNPAFTSAPALPTATLPPTALPSAVTGTVLGEVNIRYGPGTEYERVGVGFAGETFTIVARHTQFEWVQITYPASPTGRAWVATNLLEITGNLDNVQPISQTTFNLPTLTPTPSPVDAITNGVPASAEFRALGDRIWDRMLAQGFDPATSRLGAFYLKNLETGETLTLGDQFAFSGVSINKISIYTALYGILDNPPNDALAVTIAESMICSEPISSNELLALIGDGNPYTGANRVSDFLLALGLEHTFIYTPYSNDRFITPQAPQTRTTDADQRSAQPDPYNQMTISEMGSLLDSIYQCGYGTTSPLLTNFDGRYTATECRQMLNTMNFNRIGNFIESGTAAGMVVAHKHGWIEDTHGDAGIVMTPGGNYVFAMVLHNPIVLEFADSEAVIEESAREIYNYFNPESPLISVRPPDVAGVCNLLGNPAISDMQLSEFAGITP